VAVKWFFKNESILLHHLQIWHVYTACVSQFSELVTSDVGAHRDDEQEIVTGRQSFMKLFFLLLWQLYWFKTRVILWNYIYLNWNKAFFRYFKIFNFFLSEKQYMYCLLVHKKRSKVDVHKAILYCFKIWRVLPFVVIKSTKLYDSFFLLHHAMIWPQRRSWCRHCAYPFPCWWWAERTGQGTLGCFI
jgi:hypothetical protein